MRDVVLCLGRRALLRTLCFASASCCASMTSCFASLVDVLPTSCFEDAICFSLAIWVALRDAVLCSVTRSSYAASVGQFPCFLLVFAFAPSPSLSLGGGPCLSLPFLVPFSQGDHRRQQEGPGLRLRVFVRCAFFYLLFLALQAQQPKIFARFAPLCAPRAINRRG